MSAVSFNESLPFSLSIVQSYKGASVVGLKCLCGTSVLRGYFSPKGSLAQSHEGTWTEELLWNLSTGALQYFTLGWGMIPSGPHSLPEDRINTKHYQSINIGTKKLEVIQQIVAKNQLCTLLPKEFRFHLC